MVKYNMYYSKTCLYVLVLFTAPIVIQGQGNCLLYPVDSGDRQACELSYEAIQYPQGSYESQKLFDQAIAIGPNYAWAYYQKSVPFFKRGLFAKGIALIDKAIELEPMNYLYYRAYYYFYNRSYEHCIKDLEELYTIHDESYRTIPGGELEMRLLLAMAHSYVGDTENGILWIRHLMESYKDRPHLKGQFDHFCLGVLYYEIEQWDLAKTQFLKQIELDPKFADSYYYMGFIARTNSNLEVAKNYFDMALSRFNKTEGGYSTTYFTEYNTSKEDVTKALHDFTLR